MRHLLTAVICISIFLPTPEALALFGRRGPMARLLFGPGPQIIGGGRLLRGMGGVCGRGGCRPRNGCGNRGNRLNNQQVFQDEFGNLSDELGNPLQQDQFGNIVDQFGNPFGDVGNQFNSIANRGCGSGGCGSRVGCGNQFNSQFNNGFQNDFFNQFDQNGAFNQNASFGNSQFGSGFGNSQFGSVGAGGIGDPTGSGVSSFGVNSNPFGSVGTVIGQDGNPVNPFSSLGQVRPLTLTDTFRENGNQVLIGQSPNCRLFQQDQFGRSVPIDPRNEIKIFNYYQSKEVSGQRLSQNQRCVLSFYRQNFGNTPFFKRTATQTGGGATGGTTSGNHGGTSPQPGRQEVSTAPTVFSKWKADFDSSVAVKATDGHILAATVNSEAKSKKYNYTVVEQDCVSKADQDTKIPTTLILFNSKDKDGKDQSHLAFIPGGISDADKEKEVEAAWKRVTADPNEAGGGKLRNVDGDPASFYTTFSVKGLLEFPETQVQLKKIMKNGQEQFISRYIHKHGTSLPDNRWKTTVKDAPYYCENHNQPKAEKVNCDAVKPEGENFTLGGSGKITGYFLNRSTNKCEASKDFGGGSPVGPFSTQEECEKTVAAGMCKEPVSTTSSSVTPAPGGTKPTAPSAASAGQQVMVAKCLRCHTSPKADSPSAPVFNADGSIKSGSLSDILASVSPGGGMPKGGSLSAAEFEAVKQWASAK